MITSFYLIFNSLSKTNEILPNFLNNYCNLKKKGKNGEIKFFPQSAARILKLEKSDPDPDKKALLGKSVSKTRTIGVSWAAAACLPFNKVQVY